MVIALSREGQTYLGEKAIQVEDLPSLVREALSRCKEPSVKIKADQEVPVGLLLKSRRFGQTYRLLDFQHRNGKKMTWKNAGRRLN